MINDLKPYPTMKDSGVPWLGEVPEHWRLKRAKWLFRKMSRPVDDSDDVVTCFRDGIVTLRKNRRVRGFTESLKEIGYQGIRRGDLVIHAMDAFAGAIGVSDSDGKGTPVYSVCQPSPLANAYYYAYGIREMSRSQWIQALAKGIRERSTDFRFDAFAGQILPQPPIDEQAAIVRFLYHADRKIRRYIHAKQKLIKLLEEQKQVIIHRAVTRGLDPNVRLKPSGVEWLGDVPEHWEVRQVRRVAAFITSGSRGWADYYSDSGLVFIQSGNLGRNMALNFHYIQHVQPPSGSEGERTLVRTDDILICITGALTGNIVHVDVDLPGPSFVNQHVALVRVSQELVKPRFLAFTLRSDIGQSQLKTSEYGGTKQGLGLSDVKDVSFPLPTHDEQQEIGTHLDITLATFNTAISRLDREITLFREYRTRLIADVVTGKLDVREAAAGLPEEGIEEASDEEEDVEGLEAREDDLDLNYDADE
jgi:type I restriction enzyme S subunit